MSSAHAIPLGDRPGDVTIDSTTEIFSGFRTLNAMTYHYEGASSRYLPEPVTREIADIGRIAAVLPYDPVLDRFVLLQQIRIAARLTTGDADMIEIVAGLADPGESVEDAARRETLEEAGVPILDLIPAFDFMPSPGFTTEHVRLFCGRVDAANVPPQTGELHEGELIATLVVSPRDVYKALDAGRIVNGYTTQALLWFARHGARVRDSWLGVY